MWIGLPKVCKTRAYELYGDLILEDNEILCLKTDPYDPVCEFVIGDGNTKLKNLVIQGKIDYRQNIPLDPYYNSRKSYKIYLVEVGDFVIVNKINEDPRFLKIREKNKFIVFK
jgi:hypothetical protein